MNKKYLLLLASVSLAGCAAVPDARPVTVTLQPTQGNKTAGTVTFTQQGNKVLVVANVDGLAPGPHGFHIHEKGDCSAPDATSAGGHFNPSQKPHGAAAGNERHAGDMGNLNAAANGKATLSLQVEGISLSPGAPNSIIGRGLIVHADPDDYKTQPTGNAGNRVACAVIGAK
ncbi:MAG: superoxide dismutase family protein [Burkholderiales bacterium]|nr:superoxide dismutase family protein [Burkholderiales bacterium]